MKRNGRIGIMASLLAALMLASASCGGAEETVTEDTGAETTAEETTDVATDTEAQPEEPDVFPEGENIEIGIFWEPPHDFTTPEQYDWIRDANITFIEITNREGAINKEVSDKQIRLAGERGIKIAYNVGVDGKNVLAMKPEELTEYVSKLAENKTISGIHVVDEPPQPWVYSAACAAIKRGGLMPRLNFLPYFATWVFENYRGYIEDTVIAAGRGNYGYLCYDQYPFPYNSGDPDMFYNLDLFRQIGLKYDLPTAFYIQSIGEGGNFRRTNGGEIRYHTSAGLAYGLKSMTYFTWWTTGFCDPKDYAIISPYGEKTDIYDDVASINGDILKVGTLLRRLDAVSVYHTKGTEQAIVKCKAEDVPLYGTPSGRYGLIISLMRDRETGREYVMLVNKNYKKSATVELSVGEGVSALSDCTNGTYEPVDISSGSITAEFLPGGFRIYALGKDDRVIKEDGERNLAKNKPVSVDRVMPGGGFYAYCATDGLRDGSDSTAVGYRSDKDTGYIEVDLKKTETVNRIDLYPTGTKYTRGETFPRDFRLEISENGTDYTEVVSETGYDATKAIPTFTFEESKARYVRLTVTKGCAKGGFEIGEIEVYCGDGIDPPDDSAYYADASEVLPGENIAKGKGVTVLSELGGDWRKENLTDGDRHSNYSSALNRHSTADGEEWILIDLAAELGFNEVDVYPRGDGQHFPYKFRVEISDDAKTFTTVYDCDVPEIPSKGEPSVCILDRTYTARYVRILAYSLRDQKGFNDGHLLQAAEVEIYNR